MQHAARTRLHWENSSTSSQRHRCIKRASERKLHRLREPRKSAIVRHNSSGRSGGEKLQRGAPKTAAKAPRAPAQPPTAAAPGLRPAPQNDPEPTLQEACTTYRPWWGGEEQRGAPISAAGTPRVPAAPVAAAELGRRPAPQNDAKSTPRGEHSLPDVVVGSGAMGSAKNLRRAPPRNRRPAGRPRAGVARSAAKRLKMRTKRRAQPNSPGGGEESNGERQ